MKKCVLSVATMLVALTAFAAIDTKFQEGYDFKSLPLNTADKEYCLSPFEGNSLMFLQGQDVYVAGVDTAVTDLLNPTARQELTALGIQGTTAYDKDRKKLYFALPDKADHQVVWLYESTLTDSVWSKPKRLVIEGLVSVRGNSTFLSNAGWNYASKPRLVMKNPTMAKQGTRIYFTCADLQGGQGGDDIWYIDQKNEQTWAYPVNAGAGINSAADENYAFVENDATLYFSSTRENGAFQLYAAQQNGDTWATAQKLGAPYNSSTEDFNMVVKDGNPFMVSSRNGDIDIWAWVKRPVVIVPEPEPEPEPEPVVEEPALVAFPWTLVLFDFDKAKLTPKFMQELDSLAKVMATMPAGTRYVVEGHTDQRGGNAYNDELSLRRANEVRKQLIKRGVDSSALQVVAYGKRRPTIAHPKNNEEFYQNRRVVVRVLEENDK